MDLFQYGSRMCDLDDLPRIERLSDGHNLEIILLAKNSAGTRAQQRADKLRLFFGGSLSRRSAGRRGFRRRERDRTQGRQPGGQRIAVGSESALIRADTVGSRQYGRP